MSPDPTPPPGVDTTVPSPARLYDYALGGRDNYQVDREAAERILVIAPGMRDLATYNRAWLRRVVRYLAGEAGVRQFIDIGSGLPTVENVHEVAQSITPDARVVYVDHDPSVHVHGRALLDGGDNVVFVLADARDADAILDAGEVQRLIDPSEPVGLIMASVLHFFGEDDDPAGTAARLASRLPAGSYVAISHAAREDASPGLLATFHTVYQHASEYLYVRSRPEIERIIGAAADATGATMVEPGCVPVHQWRPDEEDVPAPPLTILGAVVHLPG